MSTLPEAILAAVEARITYLKEQYLLAMDESKDESGEDITSVIYGNIHEAKCIRMMIKGMINAAKHLQGHNS